MNRDRLRAALIGMTLALLSCVLFNPASATDPKGESKTDVTPTAAAHEGPVKTNFRVLPSNISIANLDKLMKSYAAALGVECSYCHVQDRETGKFDYASDDSSKKEIARVMIAMLDDINNKHLAELGGDRRYAATVSCGTCHQGRANPPPWEAPRR